MFAKRPTLNIARRPDSGDIELRVTHHRAMRRFALAHKATPEEWDTTRQAFTKVHPEHDRLNRVLLGVRNSAMRLVDEIMFGDQPFDAAEFKRRFRQDDDGGDVLVAIERIRQEMLATGRPGNASVYASLLATLRAHVGSKLAFSAVTVPWLNNWELALRARGCNSGGISNYMRTLRAVVNRAVVDGRMRPDRYPFKCREVPKGYDVAALKSLKVPRAVSDTDLEAIKQFDVQAHPHMALSYHMWMCSYYERGMNFADLAYLEWDQIYDGHLSFVRKKTIRNGAGAHFRIPVHPEVARMFELYRSRSRYVFPVLDAGKHITPQQQFDRVQKVRKKMNEDMRTIAGILGIRVNITSYVARHTFGAAIMRKGASKHELGQAFGHKSASTTEHYVDNLIGKDLGHLDKML